MSKRDREPKLSNPEYLLARYRTSKEVAHTWGQQPASRSRAVRARYYERRAELYKIKLKVLGVTVE